MRRLIQIFIVFPFWFIYTDGGLYAQDNKSHKKLNSASSARSKEKDHPKKYARLEPHQEYILRMDDKVYIRKDGTMKEVKNNAEMGSLQVDSDGRITKEDGSYVLLQEGEALSMDGRVFLFDQHQVTPDRMKVITVDHALSMKEHRKWVDKEITFLNEKINLLVNMTNLMNEKMALMNEMNNSKKLSKTKKENLNHGIAQINREIAIVEDRLEEIDKQIAKSNSGSYNSASTKK